MTSDIPPPTQEVNEFKEAWKERIRLEDTPASLQDVKATFNKWLFLDDDEEIIDIIFAAFMDRVLPGDPIWLFVIAASGGTKTEIVRSNQTEKAYTLDSLTSHTLISGKLQKDELGNFGPIGGILNEIDNKVLIIKDFTVILAKRQEERDEIFSQLRCLYDGYLEYAFGTIKEPIRVKAKIGLVAAVTPAIDQYSKLYVQLGERFLKVRHHPNKQKATFKALENLGKEEEMREDLEAVTERFLKFLKGKVDKINGYYLREIQKMAHATAILRTPVSINFWRYEINSALTPSIEYPTRLSKQLLKLAYALALIRGKNQVTHEEIETIRRVARDTAYPNRIKIIKTMEKTDKQYTTREISEATNIPLSTCWRDLKELEYLEIVTYEKMEESPGTYKPLRHIPEKDGWTLQDNNLRMILNKSVSGNPSGGGLGVYSREGTSLGFSETKKRTCFVECQNFDKPSCKAPNWQSLNKLSEIPLRCPGYCQVGAGEEGS